MIEWSDECDWPVAAGLMMREVKLSKQETQTRINSTQLQRHRLFSPQYFLHVKNQLIQPVKAWGTSSVWNLKVVSWEQHK